MIILSVGMPRAGSGWYYNLTNELMLSNGAQDAHQVRRHYHLQKILSEVNCNIGALTPRRLLTVLAPSLLGNTFVIKAHSAPTPLARTLLRLKMMRAAYIYRDPRDAMLSAIENGERARQRGHTNAFSHLVDFESALSFMQEYVRIAQAWLECEAALHVRYEDLLTDYDRETQRLVQFLGLKEDAARRGVIEKYRPEGARTDQKGLHFSQGKIGRFRQKMTLEQQEILALTFEKYLKSWGYMQFAV